jgi:uncharacterized membrane protein
MAIISGAERDELSICLSGSSFARFRSAATAWATWSPLRNVFASIAIRAVVPSVNVTKRAKALNSPLRAFCKVLGINCSPIMDARDDETRQRIATFEAAIAALLHRALEFQRQLSAERLQYISATRQQFAQIWWKGYCSKLESKPRQSMMMFIVYPPGPTRYSSKGFTI